MSGYASDAAKQHGIPRPIGLAAASACLATAMAGLTFDGTLPLYIACIIGGLSCKAAARHDKKLCEPSHLHMDSFAAARPSRAHDASGSLLTLVVIVISL